MLYSRGGFWVAPGAVSTNVFTLFRVNGQLLRVKVQEGTPIRDADKVIAVVTTGNIRYTRDHDRDKMQGVEITRPISISLRAGTNKYVIGFACGSGCLAMLECELDGDSVLVTNVNIVVA